MKKYILVIGSVFVFLATVSSAGAGDFDGSKPLLVAVNRVMECTPIDACREVTPASVHLPQFLIIDFAKKTIRRAPADDSVTPTIIERQEAIDGKLFLQGAEDGYDKMRDGLGWTMAISEENGQVVLTASGDQAAFVVFGAALPQ